MKKKRLFLTAAAILLLCLPVLLPVSRGGKKTVTAPDSEYPCTVRQTGKGLLVTVSGGEEGYRWSAATDQPYAVYPDEKSADAKKTEVLLRPVSEGNAAVTLTLEHTEVPYEPAYRLSFLVQSDGDGLTLLSTVCEGFPSAIRDAEGRYSVSKTADGGYLVCVKNGGESDWVAGLESGSAVVRPYEPGWASARLAGTETGETAAREVCFLVHGAGAGQAVVSVTDRKRDAALILTFSESEETGFRLESHEMRTGSETDAESQERLSWSLPAGAILLESGSVDLFSQEDGKPLRADQASVFMDGAVWTLLRAAGVSRNALAIRDYRLWDGAEAETDDRPVWIFQADETCCAAWETDSAAFLLSAEDTDCAAAEAAAIRMMEKTP